MLYYHIVRLNHDLIVTQYRGVTPDYGFAQSVATRHGCEVIALSTQKLTLPTDWSR